jgi:hypothetical protein
MVALVFEHGARLEIFWNRVDENDDVNSGID